MKTLGFELLQGRSRMTANGKDNTLGELVTRLGTDARQLLTAELRLAKLETSEAVARAGGGALWLGVAFGVLVVALVAFTLFLATIIGRVANGHYWIGAAVTGALELLAGGWLVWRGLGDLGQAPYSLPETRAALSLVKRFRRSGVT